MPIFIELTTFEAGNKFLLNMSLVIEISRYMDDRTTLIAFDSALNKELLPYIVKETPREIKDKLNVELRKMKV